MKTVDEILDAVKRLDMVRFLSLRRKMDQMEKRLWEEELSRTSAAMRKKKCLTDDGIDRLVTGRRREGRS